MNGKSFNQFICVDRVPIHFSNKIKKLHCLMENGCLRHSGALAVSSQLLDGDPFYGWQSLETQP